MLDRCYRSEIESYPNYGGRGIAVCERWWIFENFLSDMSPRPEGKTLERVDNNGPYAPWNCRWATRLEQGQNKRNSRHLTANGKTQSLAAWARETGIHPAGILKRLELGWSEQDACAMLVAERPGAKLTDDEVIEIRRIGGGISCLKIAAKFGVSKKTILNIRHNKNYKDLDESTPRGL